MKKRLTGMLMALLLVSHYAHSQQYTGKSLELSGYNYFTPVPVYISPDDNKWLKQKKTLRVAVYPPEHPLLAQSTVTGRYRGINADYLALIQHSLDIKVAVIRYSDVSDAIASLKAGQTDMVLTGLDYQPAAKEGLQLSLPLVHSWTALVTSMSNVLAPLHSAESVTVATVNHYPDDDFIYRAFPNAEIINYASSQEALSSVVDGQSRYFFGDSLTTGAWLSQEFSHALSAVKYWAQPQTQNLFLFAGSENRLRDIINRTINAIDEHTHGQIAQSMVDKGNLSFLIDELELTEKEKQWLSSHKTLRVIINPWFAPYTMVDSNQEARGLVGDILNLISLQTGMKFETIVVKSNNEMIAAMKQGNWHIVQAATYDLGREQFISFTHPFITTPFVTVVRTNSRKPLLGGDMRVAISSEHTLLERLKARYPKIHWELVENSSVALNLVATGKVDAAVTNQLTARYFTDHYYPGQLTFQPVADERSAAIGFAVPRSEPELRQILDKALDDVPHKEISQIVAKWTRLPDVKIDTWELYSKPFYLVAILSALLVCSSFLWVMYLLMKITERKRQQRLLEAERDSAQRANKEKRDFLARMSHEIRTPVSAIMGFLELLQRSVARFTAEDKASIDQAAAASQSLLKLVGEILDLEKIESGLVEISLQWQSIDTLVKNTMALFNALAAQKGIRLEYHSQLASNESFKVDSQLLGQVLINVIGNAVKFTRKGSVEVTALKKSGNRANSDGYWPWYQSER